jgi:hypothetical protein
MSSKTNTNLRRKQMKIDEQDFDELRNLINEALQANWSAYNVLEDNPYNEFNITEAKEIEHKLWIKFNDMRDVVKNTPLHDIINNESNKK